MFPQSCLFVIAFGKLLLQVLAEVQKQMGFFDAELKDSKRRTEEMQQALSCFLLVSDWREIAPVLIRAKLKAEPFSVCLLQVLDFVICQFVVWGIAVIAVIALFKIFK